MMQTKQYNTQHTHMHDMHYIMLCFVLCGQLITQYHN